MKLNWNNYSEVFIDYFEGNLTPSEIKELNSFLKDNPKLIEEFDRLSDVFLVPWTVEHFDFSNLSKDVNQINSVNEQNFEELCIAEIEGDLHDRKLLNQFSLTVNQDKEKQKILALYKSTRLQPDEKVVFPAKSKLKQGRKIELISSFYKTIAVAVSIVLILIIGMAHFIGRNKMSSSKEIVKSTLPTTLPSIESKKISQNNRPASRTYSLISSTKAAKALSQKKIQLDTLKEQAVLQNLPSRSGIAEIYLPSQPIMPKIIISSNSIAQSSLENSDNLSLGKYIRNKFKELGHVVAEKTAEIAATNIKDDIRKAGIEQIRKLTNNRIAVQVDSVNTRRRAEIDMGVLDLYFSYSMK
jgi:hypothetical protein